MINLEDYLKVDPSKDEEDIVGLMIEIMIGKLTKESEVDTLIIPKTIIQGISQVKLMTEADISAISNKFKNSMT